MLANLALATEYLPGHKPLDASFVSLLLEAFIGFLFTLSVPLFVAVVVTSGKRIAEVIGGLIAMIAVSCLWAGLSLQAMTRHEGAAEVGYWHGLAFVVIINIYCFVRACIQVWKSNKPAQATGKPAPDR